VAAMVRRRLLKVQGGGLVFTNGNGKQWHYANFLNRAWNPAVELANLSRRPTPHWLRHTAVFWLSMSGGSLADIQKRIGHASISTTINVYGTMIQDVSPEVLERFAAMRRGQTPDQIEA
jgi:integrase